MGYQKYSNASNNISSGRMSNIPIRKPLRKILKGGGDNTTGGAYYSPSYIKSPYDLDIDRRRGLGGGFTGGGFTGGGAKEDLLIAWGKQRAAMVARKKLEDLRKISDLERIERENTARRIIIENEDMPKPVIDNNSVVGLTDRASQTAISLTNTGNESFIQLLDNTGQPINRSRPETYGEYRDRIRTQELGENINESELLDFGKVLEDPNIPEQKYPDPPRLIPNPDENISYNLLYPNKLYAESKYGYKNVGRDLTPSEASEANKYLNLKQVENESMLGSVRSLSSPSDSLASAFSDKAKSLDGDLLVNLTDKVEEGFDKLAQRIVDLNNTNRSFTPAKEKQLVDSFTKSAKQIISDPNQLFLPKDKQLLFAIQGLPASLRNDPTTLQALQDVIKQTSGYRGEPIPLLKRFNRIKLQADPELIKSRVNPAYYGDKLVLQRAPIRLSQPSDYLTYLRTYNYRTA